MRICIVGSGGREHALAWKLRQSPLVRELLIAPGNGGTAAEGENVALADDDVPGIVELAKARKIDLVVAGPELPLTLGLSDALDKAGVPCFGPVGGAARLEGGKAFAKRIMREAGVPTADFEVFDDYGRAREHIALRPAPMVVKADGLAAGKGVVVAKTREEALTALDYMMRDKVFGVAGDRVVIEDALAGEEASFLAFCDGENVAWLPSAQDHKPIGENDTGPNTGGMGAYSPAPVLPEDTYADMADRVITPIVRIMAHKGHPFRGILYAGLMFTDNGPYVLEYNVRFGDPECQPLLMRMQGDLAEAMLACVEGRLNRLDKAAIRHTAETALCVVMSSKGYPGSYEKGKVIHGLDKAEELEGVKVFVAGARRDESNRLATTGGRVLGVTALGEDLRSARDKAYAAVDLVDFEGAYARRDIGVKGLR